MSSSPKFSRSGTLSRDIGPDDGFGVLVVVPGIPFSGSLACGGDDDDEEEDDDGDGGERRKGRRSDRGTSSNPLIRST